MYNKYYRINESRWELPDFDENFKYPNYGYDKDEKNYFKDKNLKEGWDKDIIEELTKFYNKNKDFIVTELDELEYNELYWYINFPKVTEKENKEYELKCLSERHFNFTPKFPKNRNYEIRKVIREHPELNPSYILFSDIIKKQYLSEILNAVIIFSNLRYTYYHKLVLNKQKIYWNGYLFYY